MGQLSNREQTILAAGGIIAILFMVVQFVFLPVYDHKHLLEQRLSANNEALRQMHVLQQQYRSLASVMNHQEKALSLREKGFTLFSFLDDQAERSHLKKNIDYMKPASQPLENSPYLLSKVKLKLKGIYLKDMVDFIQGIESSQNGVIITSLALSKSGKNKRLLDVVIEAQAFFLKDAV